MDRNDRRRRRRRASRRRVLIRRLIALAVLVGIVAGFAYGAHSLRGRGGAKVSGTRVSETKAPAKKGPRTAPREMRGIYVTSALASVRGKLAEYVALKRAGLNTIELDVKDENGDVGFV